jgi:hypothetical protein
MFSTYSCKSSYILWRRRRKNKNIATAKGLRFIEGKIRTTLQQLKGLLLRFRMKEKKK